MCLPRLQQGSDSSLDTFDESLHARIRVTPNSELSIMASDNVVLASIYRMTAVNFWESAKILHKAFHAKDEPLPRNIRALPFYYLVSHAFELLLKCALLKRSVTEQELKRHNLRHNLSELLLALEAKGVSVSCHTKDILQALTLQHKEHALRYTALLDDGKEVFTPHAECIYQALEEVLMCASLAHTQLGESVELAQERLP